MSKITRVTQKMFGSSGPSGDFIEFGSLANGAANYTKDPTVMQDLSNFLTGWAAATIADNRPCLEDMNTLFYLLYYQVCYLLQQGFPEWDAGTTYYLDSYCQVAGTIYKSLANDNLNYNPVTQPAKWMSTLDPTSLLQTVYPVGSIYTSTVSTNPATLFGFGTWVAFGAGKVMLGAGGGYSAGDTGGEATHQLTTAEMPAHNHDIATYTGGVYSSSLSAGTASPVGTGVTAAKGSDVPHNNMQPYIVVYLWNRTA